MYNLDKINSLVKYNNKLVSKYNLPNAELSIQQDDGYTGQIYAMDWDFKKGTIIISIEDDGLYYAGLIGKTEYNGKLTDDKEQYIVDLIRSVIK